MTKGSRPERAVQDFFDEWDRAAEDLGAPSHRIMDACGTRGAQVMRHKIGAMAGVPETQYMLVTRGETFYLTTESVRELFCWLGVQLHTHKGGD